MPLTYSQFTDANGKVWNRWLGDLMMPAEFDPNSQVFVAVAPPDGFANLPEPGGGSSSGVTSIASNVPITELEYNDPTAATATFTEITPGVYQLSMKSRKGTPGVAGTMTILSASDLSGAHTPGYMFLVDPAGTGVVLSPVKLGAQYWPGAISNLADTGTLCAVPVPAQPFDWRPRVYGQCQVTGGAADVRVDVIARLNTATTGDVVGRGFGQAGVNPPRNDLVNGVPKGSAATYGKVSAGAAANVYFRAEKQAGTSAFTASASTTEFFVEVAPL